MKIFICCSKAFYDKIPDIKKELELKGHSIILPNSFDNPNREYEILSKDPKEHAIWKAQMFKKSENQIKEIDAMLVLNFKKNDIENYIGGATFLEMYDAFRHNKKVFLYNDIPEGMLFDEIKGFSPVLLKGHLGGII